MSSTSRIPEILPGILEKEWAPVEERLELAKPFAKAIHIDLLDGKFAPNTSYLDPKPFAKYKDTFFLELHMMVHEPIEYLQSFADAGFRRFIGHVEHMSDQAAFVSKAQELGEAMLAVDAKTPIDAITVPEIDLDGILIMTVNAGFSHQQFMPECLEKVRLLSEKTEIPIAVDGGINDLTIRQAFSAGASRFVSTNFLFVKGEPETQFQILQKLLSANGGE